MGVFLQLKLEVVEVFGLPHVRGGVSDEKERCIPLDTVFPTCVGVFPGDATDFGDLSGLPHVRGGVSMQSKSLLRIE